MAKKNAPARKTPNSSADNTIVYKAMADLGILCLAFFLLHYIDDFYPTADGYFLLRPIFGIAAIAFAAVGAVLVVLLLLKKCGKTAARLFSGFAAAAFILAVMSWCLYAFWTAPLAVMNILVFGGCILYLIHLLYPNDLTVILTATFFAGIAFYLHKTAGSVTASALLFYVISALFAVLMLCAGLAASKNGGRLTLCGKSFRLFAFDGSPIPLYLTAVLWLVCGIVTILLGPALAKYSLYAACGYGFIAACYYTIRLN